MKYASWMDERSELAFSLAKGSRGANYADGAIVLCIAISAMSSLVWIKPVGRISESVIRYSSGTKRWVTPSANPPYGLRAKPLRGGKFVIAIAPPPHRQQRLDPLPQPIRQLPRLRLIDTLSNFDNRC